MEHQTTKILGKMTLAEYREFVRNLLGMVEFVSNGKRVIKEARGSKNKKGLTAIATDNQEAIEYYVDEECKKSSIFRDNHGNTYSVKDFSSISDEMLFLLIIASKKTLDKSIDFNAIDISKIRTLIKNENGVGFILGAGINSKLGPKGWEDLLGDIEHIIIGSKLVSTSGMKSLRDASNINYLMPQVAKDISTKRYFETILDSNYGGVNWDHLDAKRTPSFINHNLYQVARILAKQKGKGEPQRVLTFNYDDLLETVLNVNFGVPSFSEYQGHKMPEKAPFDIRIVHSHGFLPHLVGTAKLSGKQKSSIVLSSFEYMEKYMNRKRYSYEKLEEQLQLTNIILGNSMSDYEEQKVFYSFHRRHLNRFHFLITKQSGDGWVDWYKRMFMLRLGVVVLYFQNWTEVNSFLKTL